MSELEQPLDPRDFRFKGEANVYAEGYQIARYDSQACDWMLVIDGVHVGVTQLIEKLVEIRDSLEAIRNARSLGS